MHFLKKTCLFIALFIFSNHALSQNLQFGGTLSFAKSKTALKSSREYIGLEIKTKFANSGNIGVFLEKRIGTKSSLGFEALWIQIEGILNSFADLTVVNRIGYLKNEYIDHFSYFGLPIYYKFHFQKLGIKVGFQPMLFLFASAHFSQISEINGSPFSYYDNTKNIKLNNDYGPKIGIDYSIFENLNLRLDYYHGLKDINRDRLPSSFTEKNRQLSLGISFYFQQKKESKS